MLGQWDPATVLFDPWNAVTHDDKARDYLESFDMIRSVIPPGDQGPAIGIVPHTRKPQAGERANGRALLNLLAGSYVLSSVPRTVWILQHASDDVNENRVVVTCAKNNDGELEPRSVWTRDNGLWTPYQGFDWDQWDNPDTSKKEKPITELALKTVFANGPLSRADAVEALSALTGKRKSTCYNALKLEGPHGHHFYYDKRTKLYKWIN
jgi:hypothetical protein